MSKKHSGPARSRSAARSDRRTMRAFAPPSTEIARLRGGFLAWLADNGVPPDVDLDALWDDTVAAVDLAVDRAGLQDLRVWTPERVTAVHEAAGEADGDLLATLPLLLRFLAATGRWSGSEAELEAVLAVAEDLPDALAELLDDLLGVTVDEDAEDAALRALPLVGHAEALVRFLLPSRPITATGALRLADVPAAAELAGVDLQGRRLRSMWDVARLPDLWTGLADVGLLTLTGTEALPAPAAQDWINGEQQAGRVARRMALGGYLSAVLTAPPPSDWLADPLETVLPALAAATLDRPVRTELLLQAIAADEGGPAALLPRADLGARGMFGVLAREGILEVADTITVPIGLRRVVARSVAALLRGEEPA